MSKSRDSVVRVGGQPENTGQAKDPVGLPTNTDYFSKEEVLTLISSVKDDILLTLRQANEAPTAPCFPDKDSLSLAYATQH
jgi:hypothetical protein